LFALPALGPLLAFRYTRNVPIRFGVWAATFGLSHQQLPELARTHMKELVARGESFVRKDALAQLRQHLAQGHQVLVATGCLQELADEILFAEGLDQVVVVGSSVRKCFGGMVVHEHCFGERKLSMLAARGFAEPGPYRWDFVYTDHHSDLPLLMKGKHRYLVNPMPNCVSKLTAALGETVTVLTWN
jgi:phosphatidylglycerophosphatase C